MRTHPSQPVGVSRIPETANDINNNEPHFHPSSQPNMQSRWFIAPSILAAVILVSLVKWRKRTRKLPPGPPKLPLIDNMLNMPNGLDWFDYANAAKQYGSDILHFGAPGVSIVVLNSLEAAQELLEKRSGIYSSRAYSVMFNDLSGWDFMFALYPYGDQWREERRLFTKHLGPNTKVNEMPEIQYSRRLLLHLQKDPERFFGHIRHMVGSVIISMVYGVDVQHGDDPYVGLAQQASAAFSKEIISGTYMVDIFPALRYLPTWFPGTKFLKRAARVRKITLAARTEPFATTERLMQSGTCRPCFVTSGLEEAAASGNLSEIEGLKNIAAQAYLAGADTSTSVICSFILMMLLHPDIQRRAQAEVDQVTQGRLPEHKDLDSLHFLHAIIMELHRCKIVNPVGIPHVNTMDDVYNGYHIPKNSLIVPNQWAMMRNEEDYPEPESFKPERFIGKDGKLNRSVRSPMDIAFGFGRRACPGRHLAHSKIMIATASILAAFDISKKKDSTGRDIEPSGEYRLGIACQPKPFPCAITLRSGASDLLSACEGFGSTGGLGPCVVARLQ